MKDRFKFRAWNPERNEFIYNIQDVGSDFSIQCWEDCFGDFLFNEDYIIEQCTGLKDKNGKLVYEGDILGGVLASTYVHWCKDCKSFQLKNSIGDCMCCGGDIFWYEVTEDNGKLEVVGNIHENPELLEE